MQIQVTCCFCDECFDTDSSQFEHREVVVGTQELTLTILTCPICGSEMVVQIDNEETGELLLKQMGLNMRIGKAKYYKRSYKREERELQAVTDRLLKTQEDLIAEYGNTFYQFKDNVFKLEFHRPTVQVIG